MKVRRECVFNISKKGVHIINSELIEHVVFIVTDLKANLSLFVFV